MLVSLMRGKEQTAAHKDAVAAVPAGAETSLPSKLLPMFLSSHQRPTQDLGLAEMTRQLQARLQQAPRRDSDAPIPHDDICPRIACKFANYDAGNLAIKLAAFRAQTSPFCPHQEPSAVNSLLAQQLNCQISSIIIRKFTLTPSGDD
jgi:hypothetical protein